MTLVRELRSLAHHRVNVGEVWIVVLTHDVAHGRAGDSRYVDEGTRCFLSFSAECFGYSRMDDPVLRPDAAWLAVIHETGVAVYELEGVPAR